MTGAVEAPELAAGPAAGEDLRGKALHRLEQKRDFRTHLLVYLVVNASLWAVWGVVLAVSGFAFPWPVFPLFFWAIGLILHAWEVYRRHEFTEQEIQRELAHVS